MSEFYLIAFMYILKYIFDDSTIISVILEHDPSIILIVIGGVVALDHVPEVIGHEAGITPWSEWYSLRCVLLSVKTYLN